MFKRTFAAAFLVVSLLTGVSFAQQAPAGAPKQPEEPPIPVKLEPTDVDFGVCKPSEKKPTTFTLVNVGTSPLTIKEVAPSCKCTDLENVAGKVIQPGEKLMFKASMAMPPAPGTKDAKVFIKFDGWRQRVLIAKMKAVVKMAVEATPDHLDAVAKKDPTTKQETPAQLSGMLTVKSRDGKPFTILSAGGEAPKFVGFNPTSDQPRNSYELQWDVSKWPCEGMKLWWIIETDHPECAALPVEIWHDCTGSKADPDRLKRGWMIRERIAYLGAVAPGVPTTYEVDTGPGRKGSAVVPVTAVESLTSGVTAKLISYQSAGPEDGRVKFEITAPAGHKGLLYVVLLFKSSTGDAKLTVVGTVKGETTAAAH